MIKKGQLVKNYLKRFPNTPSLSIAKKLYSENNEIFKDVEDVRSIIRYYRGVKGNSSRKNIKEKKHFIKPYTFENAYNIPKSDATKPKVFTLPREHNNILCISDVHIPYHDIKAISQAIKYGIENKINTIVINGDLLDFFMISRFTNVERKRSVSDELGIAREFLDVLNKTFPNVPIYFLLGNHDNRLETYLATKAPEILDMEEFRLSTLLEAEKHNMKVFTDTTLLKAGKLTITHGHLLLRGMFAPVNPARGSFLKAKASVLVGHTHKVSTHSETTINGKIITCYSTGCLSELNPSYSPFANNYSHGFAHIIVGDGGHYKVKNLQLIDGEIIN